jgi:uncharacterized membrane protein (UPF0127 family)
VTAAPGKNRRIMWVLATALVILALAVGLFLIRGVTTTQRPRVDTNGARPSRVAGFDQIAFTVRASGGAVSRHCGLLALTTAQQDTGLMNRSDLAGYDGMVFQFLDPTTVQFYMKDTLIALSIAWFDTAGRFVSATDMPPCGSAAICPLYAAKAPYVLALEVPQGGLGQVGVGPGSSLSVGGSC